ncbi:MAG TPA: hypothetical protein ENH25_00620 [candidate division Zixibacteria bacterium]|nr:hypothetical protein [candidate division Zixibacteria bacterium]
MPFCPKCRYEYKPEILICPDCDVSLVDVLPPEPEAAEIPDKSDQIDGDWVPVALLTSPQYAEMVEEALRGKDIPVIIHSGAGHFGQIGATGPGSMFSASGGYLVLVNKDFIVEADQEASAILGDVWKKSRLIDLDN